MERETRLESSRTHPELLLSSFLPSPPTPPPRIHQEGIWYPLVRSAVPRIGEAPREDLEGNDLLIDQPTEGFEVESRTPGRRGWFGWWGEGDEGEEGAKVRRVGVEVKEGSVEGLVGLV